MANTAAPGRRSAQIVLFCRIPDDILFNILCRLDADPRDLACLACVSTRFCKVIKSVCWKLTCEKTLPLLVKELLQPPSPAYNPLSEPPGGWAALQKLHVCCPGLWHAGVLLRNWDFEADQGLDLFDSAPASEFLRIRHSCDAPRRRDADEQRKTSMSHAFSHDGSGAIVSCSAVDNATSYAGGNTGNDIAVSEACPYRYATEHSMKCNKDGPPFEGDDCLNVEVRTDINGGNVSNKVVMVQPTIYAAVDEVADGARRCALIEVGNVDEEKQKQHCMHKLKKQPKDCRKHKKRQRDCQHVLCHIATGSRNLSREQGNKLLANRFRTDSLYICDWPGCIHPGDKRIYKLFRGVFKNFKSSHVYRNLKDMQAKPMNVGCAFCICKSTWDMVTNFCLKRSIEFHDDGEPVVQAYVCENGHVAGAWTDRPIYT